MKKGKSIALLSILGVIIAALIVLAFVRFPVGVSNYNSFIGAYDLDYDLAGGYAYTLTLSDENEIEIEDKDAFINTVSDRLATLGYGVYSVKGIESTDISVDDYAIRIEVKKSDNAANDVAAAVTYGKIRVFGGTSSSEIGEILTDIKAIESASYLGSIYNDGTTYQNFSVKFTEEAKEELETLMGDGTEYYIKVMLGEDDGDYSTTLFDTTSGSSPFSIIGSTNSAYSNGPLSLSYGSNAEQVKRMVMLMNDGGIDYKFDMDQGSEITSPLGNVSLAIAVSIAIILVAAIVFLSVIGKGYGIVACLSVLLMLPIYLFMFVAIPGITVNLGTVIGMLATALLVADGLFVVYKRISEEFANGKTVKSAIKSGFKRALMPTLSTGIVTIILSLLTVFLSKGVVNGFAIAFGIGGAAYLVIALLFARMFTSLVLPLVKPEKQESFLKLKREEK